MVTIYILLIIIGSIIVCCCACCWCHHQQNTQKKYQVQPDIEAGHPVNTEKVKPKQWVIKNTDLEDSSSDSSVSTTDIEPLLHSTNSKAKKEYDVAMRADKEYGTLLWTNTDKVNKKMQMIVISN